MKRILSFVTTLALGCFISAAHADIICLKNGNIIEGIVVQDTVSVVELEVLQGAEITFNKNDIAYVKQWTAEENQALRNKWQDEKQERKEAELARQEFEAEQKKKGLVKYRGQWVSQPEAEDLKTRDYIDEVLKKKEKQGELTDYRRKERSKIARSLLAKGHWNYRQTEHFIIYYEDVVQSKMVADRAEYYYEKIAYDLNYEKTIYWPEKCEVFVIPSKEKWQEYMQEHLSRFDHVGGFVPSSNEKEIYLCALSLAYLSVTFPHELTHLIFKEFAQNEYIPLWLNEGLAIYESGLIGYADETLRTKVKQARHISLKRLVEMKDYPRTKEEIEMYYAQSEKIVEFLIAQHGRSDFSRFCKLLLSGYSFSKALNLVYGHKYYNMDEFTRAWIKYVLR